MPPLREMDEDDANFTLDADLPQLLGDLTATTFPEEWNLSVPIGDEGFAALQEPDYSRFENWIPRFIRPDKPCDYCRSRRLDCYLQRGVASCTPCNSLFRECSLTNSHTLEASNYLANVDGTFLDTLHVVDEDAAKEQGGLTGIRPLASKQASGASGLVRSDDAPGSSKRNGIRFPRHAVKTLRDWLDTHADHPYPTEDEKVELGQQTELKPSQIMNWLANARRRRKATDRYRRPKVCESPSLRPSTPAIAVPRRADKPWDELNPFERWKHSPPENEPAAFTDIAIAIANSDLPDENPSSPSSGGPRGKRSSNGSGFSNVRAASTTSLDTSKQSSSLSASSAAFSQGSSHSHGSFGSFSSGLGGKKDRRRRRRPVPLVTRSPHDDKRRIFQCTFCTDTFKSKYDWTRHEKSLHLSLEKWVCAPLGPIVSRPSTATGSRSAAVSQCVYCDAENPSEEHLESHNYRQCEEKGIEARTFYRKDHLRQHLRLMHGCGMPASMDSWKTMAVNINSRCGFCAQRFTVWQERVDHLTAHFKAGSRMSEWKGCRGLDPAVAAQVTNAMPPYLIGIESVSPNPFSATRSTSVCHLVRSHEQQTDMNAANIGHASTQDKPGDQGMGSQTTCWEILAIRLGKFAKEQSLLGVVLTDDMLQRTARIILFGSDDSWNQTAADNPEWLDLFKKAHGLDFIPSVIGGQGLEVPEDLETYGDLGLRVPFAVQLQAFNRKQRTTQMPNDSNVPGPFQAALDRRREELRRAYAKLQEAGVFQSEDYDCGHVECQKNLMDTSYVDGENASGPRHRRWCTHTIPPDISQIPIDSPVPSPGGSSNPYSQSIGIENTKTHHQQNWEQELGSILDLEHGVDSPTRWQVAELGVRDGAAHARAQSLNILSMSEAGCCRSVEDNAKQEQTLRARERALSARSRTPAFTPVDSASTPRGKKPYLRRHKLELPEERARRFETITGPWQDSGMMPDPISTAAPVSTQDDSTTTTAAMMEFLGGNIGGHLPFSNHATTSTIALPMSPTGLNWDSVAGLASVDQATLMQDIDDLVAVSAEGHAPPTYGAAPDPDVLSAQPAMDPAWMTTTLPEMTEAPLAEVPADSAMSDLTFDELTFDSVFDMPMDDTFDLGDHGCLDMGEQSQG